MMTLALSKDDRFLVSAARMWVNVVKSGVAICPEEMEQRKAKKTHG